MQMDEVRVRVLPDGRLSRADAAKFLGLASGTPANWYSRGRVRDRSAWAAACSTTYKIWRHSATAAQGRRPEWQ